jgi:hypothetical protein
MTQKILSFSGRKQSGKNTCCNLLIGFEMVSLGLTSHFKIKNGQLWVNDILGDNENNQGIFDVTDRRPVMKEFLSRHLDPFIKIYSFADLLKRNICMDVLGLTESQCYGTDEEKNTETQISWGDIPIPNKQVKAKKLTAREVMQYVGTDIFRKMYPNVWVDATIRKIQQEGSMMALICDCRFPNEVEGIQNVGGKVVRLTRNSGDSDGHSSEVALDENQYDWNNFDAVIDNSNLSLSEQNKAVYDTLKSFGWLDFDVLEEK